MLATCKKTIKFQSITAGALLKKTIILHGEHRNITEILNNRINKRILKDFFTVNYLFESQTNLIKLNCEFYLFYLMILTPPDKVMALTLTDFIKELLLHG